MQIGGIQTSNTPRPIASHHDPRRRGVLEWFWRGSALSEARRDLLGQPSLRKTLQGRAQRSAELAHQLLDSGKIPASGSVDPVACDLFRQSAYWSLNALNQAIDPRDQTAEFSEYLGNAPRPSFAKLWASTDRGLLTRAAGGPATLEELRLACTGGDCFDFAERTPEEQSRLALLLQRFADRLLESFEAPRERINQILLQRALRLGGAMLTLLLLGAVVLLLIDLREQQIDLARNRAWSTSSVAFGGCTSPAQYCDESPAFFFHTREEINPWIRIDLGKKTRFSQLRVINRKDCCKKRASPLIIEASNDDKSWKTLSQQTGSFSNWKAQFPPVEARYVRLRVPNRTSLHLAGVRILP